MTDIIQIVQDGSLEAIAQIGPIRAYRIERDLGVSSIPELAELSVEQLQTVWSIGPVVARRITGSVQGHMSRYESETSTFDRDARVAVIVPRSTSPEYPSAESVLDEAGLDEDEQVETIFDAVESTGIDPVEDDVRIITHDGAPDVVDEWYDQVVFESFDGENATTCRKTVETPWNKYTEGVKYKAAQDRNEELVMASSHVVIVCNGEYSSNLRQECERQGVRHKTVHTLDHTEPELGLLPWTPADEKEYEFRGFEVDDVESWQGSATKYTGPGAEHVDDHHRLIETDDEPDDPDGLSIEEATDTGGPVEEPAGVEARPGSEIDMAPEGDREFLTQKSAEMIDEDSRIDKNDLEDGDPGGGKVGEFYETDGLV